MKTIGENISTNEIFICIKTALVVERSPPGMANTCLFCCSYYFAEVLKYLYLSFTDPNVVNLND